MPPPAWRPRFANLPGDVGLISAPSLQTSRLQLLGLGGPLINPWAREDGAAPPRGSWRAGGRKGAPGGQLQSREVGPVVLARAAGRESRGPETRTHSPRGRPAGRSCSPGKGLPPSPRLPPRRGSRVRWGKAPPSLSLRWWLDRAPSPAHSFPVRRQRWQGQEATPVFIATSLRLVSVPRTLQLDFKPSFPTPSGRRMGLATWSPEAPPTLRLSRRPARDPPVLPPRGQSQLHSAAGRADPPQTLRGARGGPRARAP